MKNKKYITVGTIPRSNIKIDTSDTNTRPVTFLVWYMDFNTKVAGLI